MQASHMMGSDIEWKCVGTDSFEVTLSVYRDCTGIDFFTAPRLVISRCEPVDTSLLSYTVEDITPVCGNTCTQCDTAACGYAFGVEQHSATYLVDLSGQNCSEVYFSWGRCCRSGNITTTSDTGSFYSFYTEAYLNLDETPCNNSPQFNANPTPIFCDSQQVFYSQAITSNDTSASGELLDSTVFEWTYPLEPAFGDSTASDTVEFDSTYAFNDPITWKGKSAGKSRNAPMPYGLHLDSVTGDLRFTPVNAGEQSIFAIKVSEYRNDTLVSYTRRDIQVIITDCPNNQAPTLTGYNGTNKVFGEIPVGSNGSFNIYSDDPDNPGKGDTVSLDFRRQSLPAGANWTDNSGDTLMASGTISWNPDVSHGGQTFQFSLQATDDNCPQSGRVSKTYSIKVCDTFKPSSPDLRKATIYDSDSVGITWDTSNDNYVNKYEVFYSERGDSFQSAGIFMEENVQPNQFIQKSINPKSQSYCYYVEAIDSCSGVHSMPSDTHCIMQLQATGGQRENYLYWHPYEGPVVDSYTVERYSSGAWQPITTISAADTSYTDSSNARCNITYRYRIRAEWEDGSNYTSLSDTARAIPFDTVAPDAPEIHEVSVNNSNNIEITFDTSDATDLSSYIIYSSVNGNIFIPIGSIADTGQGINQFEHTGIRPDINRYCYYVQAIDSCAGNTSKPSTTHCAVQLSGKAGNLENFLQWKPYTGFTNPDYYVQKETSTNVWQTLASGTDTSYSDTSNLACHVQEKYRIMTVSSTGTDTSYSDTLHLTPYDTIAPPKSNMHFVSANTQGQAELEWDWKQQTNQKYFEIWRDQGNNNFQLLDTVIYDSSYIDMTASPMQTKHRYYVIAADSCLAQNRSVPSDTEQIMIPLAETGACQPEVRLSWNSYKQLPEKTDYYEIYRKEQGAATNFTAIDQSANTNFTDSLINDGVTYCYRIQAVDTESGYSSWTDSICMGPFVYPDPDTAIMKRASVEFTSRFNGKNQLSWSRYKQSDTFARGYHIYHRTSNTGFKQIANIGNLTDTTFTHTNLNTRDSNHYYHVKVYNLCDKESPASQIHRTINLELTNQNLSTDVNWTSYAGFPVQFYRVYRSINGNDYSVINQTSGTNFIDSNISCQNDYSYKIEAFSANSGLTSWSDTQTVSGFDTIPPERANMHTASITSTSVNNGNLELTFSGAGQHNRKGYYLYKAIGSGIFVKYDTILTYQQNNLTYQDQNLNTVYDNFRYYLRSFDSCGNIAAPSDTHKTIHMEAVPRNGFNEITWTSYKGWDNYDYIIERKGENSNTWKVIATANSSSQQYKDSNVICKKIYDYRIRGREQGTMYEAFSNHDTARAFENNPPEPPEVEKASVIATGITNGKVLLTWKHSVSQDVKDYHIERSTNGINYQRIATVNGNRLIDSGLNTSGNSYYYRIQPEDSCGNIGAFSTVHRTILLKVEGGNEVNNLNWSPYLGRAVLSYKIYRDGEQLASVDSGNYWYNDENVICDKYYQYEVRAELQNTTIIIARSNTDSAKAYDTKPPEATYVRRVTVDRFNDVVEIKWDESNEYDAKGYEVYRNLIGDAGKQKINVIENKEKTIYHDTFNVDNREVCYEIRVTDRCGNTSSFSNRGCIIHPEGTPLELKNKLTWNDYAVWRGGENSYEIYKYHDSSMNQLIGETQGDNNSFIDDDLADQATRFCYFIRAEGFNNGEYSRSTKICIKQKPVVHIPNSFSPGVTPEENDKFGLKGLYIKEYTMEIYNRWGQRVFKTTNSGEWNGKFRGEFVPQGVYSYKVIVTGVNGSTKSFDGTLTVIR